MPPILETTGFRKFSPLQFVVLTSPVVFLMSFSDIGIAVKFWHILLKDVGLLSLTQVFLFYIPDEIRSALKFTFVNGIDGADKCWFSTHGGTFFGQDLSMVFSDLSLRNVDENQVLFVMHCLYTLSLRIYLAYVECKVKRPSTFPTTATRCILRQILRRTAADKYATENFKKLLLMFTLDESRSLKFTRNPCCCCCMSGKSQVEAACKSILERSSIAKKIEEKIFEQLKGHELECELREFAAKGFSLADNQEEFLCLTTIFFKKFDESRKNMSSSHLLSVAEFCGVEMENAFTELENPPSASEPNKCQQFEVAVDSHEV